MELEQTGPLRIRLPAVLAPTVEEPHRFLPVFDTYEAAVIWMKAGRETAILEVRECVEEEKEE